MIGARYKLSPAIVGAAVRIRKVAEQRRQSVVVRRRRGAVVGCARRSLVGCGSRRHCGLLDGAVRKRLATAHRRCGVAEASLRSARLGRRFGRLRLARSATAWRTGRSGRDAFDGRRRRRGGHAVVVFVDRVALSGHCAANVRMETGAGVGGLLLLLLVAVVGIGGARGG